ncbi:putative thymidylate kinase [uncultured archaeon]|nr:putative thymidylate kinase [uncultured archaeon]
MSPNIELKRGVLIAMEGIDGAGKTTQTKKLQEILIREGFDVVCFKEPTSGKWGMKIRDIALNGRSNVTAEQELNYFILDREEDVRENIEPALKSNKIVIMDRYYYSNIAYQGALGIDPKEIQRINENRCFPKPDVVIILDVAPNIGISRIKRFRKEKLNNFEQEKYLSRVRELFQGMEHEENVQIIDGSRLLHEVKDQISNIAHDVIQPLISEKEPSIINELKLVI